MRSDKNKLPLKNNWPWVLITILTLILMVPALLGHHSWRNLEPYPDGLTYLAPALNLVRTGQFGLVYRDSFLHPGTPPLYSLLLAAGMVVWPAVEIVLLLNMILLLGSWWLFDQVWQREQKPNWTRFLLLGLAAAHASIWWIVGLPMMETLVMFLLCLAWWGAGTTPKTSKPWVVFGVGLVLLFTKFAYLPTAVFFIAWAGWQWLHHRHWRSLASSALWLLLASLLFIWYNEWVGSGILNAFQWFAPTTNAAELTSSKITFFSFSYALPRFLVYSSNFLGQAGPFLWQTSPLTGLGVTALACLGLWQKRRQLGLQLFWWGMVSSLISIPLIFITPDTRFILPTLISLLIAIGWAVPVIKSKLALTLVVGVVVLTVAIPQVGLWREVIANNILHRSEAWQLQAVQTLHQETPPNSWLITALPPFLFSIYHPHAEYRLLPLSPLQEYISKNQLVWGSDVPYQEVESLYPSLLAHGEKVYVSNAYISHNHEVAAGFDTLQQSGRLELVKEGCLGTCNLYRLLPDNQ